MSAFLSPLSVGLMVDADNANLTNREGRQLWIIEVNPFSYQSDVALMTFTVPVGFVTDFASVPRIPFIYDFLGDLAQRPAVIHDYIYSTAKVAREIADEVLLEAMQLTGVSWLQRTLIYWGVRIGGASHYGK